eukprot:3408688-Rhodomonas_salina.1
MQRNFVGTAGAMAAAHVRVPATLRESAESKEYDGPAAHDSLWGPDRAGSTVHCGRGGGRVEQGRGVLDMEPAP